MLFRSLQQAQAHLSRALSMEESLWKQRSRVKWLQLGDRNTKFFHSVVKQRRMQAVIHGIQDCNQEWVTEDELVGAEAVRYFSTLFSNENMKIWIPLKFKEIQLMVDGAIGFKNH